jgi:alkyl hydroperoxide reductase subunit AhpC
MSLKLGEIAPDFKAETSKGAIEFHKWLGDSLAILFSHPVDFTPMSTTELGTVSKLQKEFEKRNVKTIALSVDSYLKWIEDINENQRTNV